jgi:hypothetical protein
MVPNSISLPMRPRSLLLAAAIAIIFPALAEAATRNVDKGNAACNDATGTPFCTVQAAINAATAGDRIEIAAGTYIEALTVDRNLTLAGAGISATEGACDGQTNLTGNPAISVLAGVTATLTNVTIKDGIGTFGGGIANAGVLSVTDSEVCKNAAFTQGGGIYTSGPLNLRHVQVYDNEQANTGAEGGGLFVQTGGVAIVRNSSFTSNRVSRGGGISVAFGATLVLSRSTMKLNIADSTFASTLSSRGGGINNSGLVFIDETQIGEGNTVAAGNGLGGGIFNDGYLVVTRSLLWENAVTLQDPNAIGVGFGGGLYNTGVATITSSTVSGNLFDPRFSGFGAGIANTGTLSLSNVTVTDNADSGAATAGAGLYSETGTATIRNSIIASQAVGEDCSSGVVTDGHNIDSDGTCGLVSVASGGTDQPNVADPGLLPLADNGGPTRTHNLTDVSPAIDGGDPAACLADLNGVNGAHFPLRADQRGNIFVEVSGAGGDPSGCDIGAVEFNLIVNGMMEDDKDGDHLPDRWAGTNLAAADRLYCFPPRKYASGCVFGLSGDPLLVKQLTQSVDRSATAGDRYSLVVFSSGVFVAGTPQVRVKFDDLQTIGEEEEFVLPLSTGTYLYQSHTLDITLAGNFTFDRVTVTIEGGTGGGLLIDDVSLVQKR